jgi:hypothetical protein
LQKQRRVDQAFSRAEELSQFDQAQSGYECRRKEKWRGRGAVVQCNFGEESGLKKAFKVLSWRAHNFLLDLRVILERNAEL